MPQSYTKSEKKQSTKFENNQKKESLDKKNRSFLESNHRIKAPNHTQTPNEFFDFIAQNLKESGLRVMLFLIRKTFGWHQEWAKIRLEDIIIGTGMYRQSCINGINELIKKNLIEKKQIGPQNRLETYYRIITEEDSNNVLQSSKETPQGSSKKTPRTPVFREKKVVLKKLERNILRNNTKKSEPPKTPPSSAIIFSVKIGEVGITEEEYKQLSLDLGETSLIETIESMKTWISEPGTKRKFKQKDLCKKIRKWHELYQRKPKVQIERDIEKENKEKIDKIKANNIYLFTEYTKNPFWAKKLTIHSTYILVEINGKRWHHDLHHPGLEKFLEKILAKLE